MTECLMDKNLMDLYYSYTFDVYVNADDEADWCPKAGCNLVFSAEKD